MAYGNPLSSNIFDPRRRRQQALALTPEQERTILGDVAEMAGGAFSNLAWALDTPAAGLRAALVGENPLTAMMADADERTTGRDILREYGLAGKQDTWANYLIGAGLEAALDPLLLVKGPSAALTQAGKAASKAGLLDDAGRALSKKYLANPSGVSSGVASRAKAAVSKMTKDGRLITDSDLYANPLVKSRASKKLATLDDVVRYSDDPMKAEADVVLALGMGDAKAGKKAFDELRNQRLSNDIGLLGVGTADLGRVGDVYRDAMDTVGNKIRWSPLGRASAVAFDRKVGGQYDADLQALNIAASRKAAARKEIATRDSVDALSALAQSKNADGVFSEKGNIALGEAIEADLDDAALDQLDPAVAQYIRWWKEASKDALAESKEMGLNASSLKDPNVPGYLPYQADPMFEMASKDPGGLRRTMSTMTGDMLRRGTTLRLKGGRKTIMELSKDKVFTGPKRSALNDQEAAELLANKLFQTSFAKLDKAKQKQMESLARLLHKLPNEATDKAALFGQHPTQQIQQYLEGRAAAQGNMDALIDGVASYATEISAKLAGADLPHSSRGYMTADAALRKIGARSYGKGSPLGGRQQLRERIAQSVGTTADKIDLSKYSVPLEFIEKIARSQEAFTNPKAASDLVRQVDAFTQVWKSSILAFPSRIVRDLYSGQFSNWLVGASSIDGINASRALLMDGADKSGAEWIARLPQYASIADPLERTRRFQADLAATGLMQGGSMVDHAATASGKSVLDQLPGQTRVTAGAALAELGPQAGRDWAGYAKSFTGVPTTYSPTKDLTNPILRFGDMGNRWSDGINRLSGYYTLLAKGFSPAEAAAQIKRVQVDYSDLSRFEKDVLRRIFPWYTYQSKIFREVLGQLATDPGGRYAQMVRGVDRGQQEASSEGDHIPSWLRKRIAIPFYETETGTRYGANLDLPGISQIQMLPNMSRPGAAGQVFKGVAEQLAPIGRVGVELLSGRDLYHDKPLTESDSGLWSRASAAAFGRPTSLLGVPNYIADRVIGNVPFVQRPAQVVSRLLDTRGDTTFGERLATTAVDSLTGFKSPVITDEQRDRDLNQLLGESIQGLPQKRSMSIDYIPEELQPYAPQWALDRMKLKAQRSRQGPTRQ